MLKRLRSRAGETMTETLVSILISALALTVLATVIGTSVNLVKRSREHMAEFYRSESEMAKNDPTPDQIELEVPLDADEKKIDVNVYSSDGHSNIVFYERSPHAAP